MVIETLRNALNMLADVAPDWVRTHTNSELFVDSHERHQVELIGPTRSDNHWQAKEGTGFAAADFAIDWEQQEAICPGGKASVSWTPAIEVDGVVPTSVPLLIL